jgi:cell division protein FtsI/penicillin-binding protein 2
MSTDQKKSFNARVLAFQIFLALFIALIILRLFVISVAQHGYYSALAENQHSFFQKLTATRGEIFITDKFSSTPYPVATNSSQNLIYTVPGQVKSATSAAEALSKILSLDQKDLLSKLSDTKRQYIALAHGLTDDQSNQVQQLKLAGIYLEPENTRLYPEGDFLSQVLGFVGFKDNSQDKVGLYGLEKYFEKILAGTNGQISTEADLKGNWITGSKRDFTPAEDGSSLVLTIDRSIQFKTESVLRDAVQKHGADSGTAIVADPKSGAILAMANYPSFDPNQYNKAPTPAVYLNSATTENYEPGSTMKAVTLSAALDQGLITPVTTFQDSGEVDIGGYKIQNSDHKAHGNTTMTEVIDHSLNTGAIWVEQQLGNQKFFDYVKKFVFGKATGIELPETAGDLANLDSGRQINFYTAAFGQGITATPIQMLQSYMAIANGGKMMQPHIVSSIIAADGKVTATPPKLKAQVISDKAAGLMSAMLVDDVENGYGKQAGVKGYFIAGKTGTAQIAANGAYVKNANIGSFIGFGPAEDPKFAMIVNIVNPKDVSFAESTAAPAFGQIANFILNYDQIPPSRH